MIHQEKIFDGTPVSPGIAIGTARVIGSSQDAVSDHLNNFYEIDESQVEAEISRFRRAVEVSQAQLRHIRDQIAQSLDESHAQIMSAQLMFLEDSEFIDYTIDQVRAKRRNAEHIFNSRVEHFLQALAAVEDEFTRARDSDLIDVARRLTNNLLNPHGLKNTEICTDKVIVTSDLTPTDTAGYVKARNRAFVLEKGGRTSHTAILARALEIPTVLGVRNILSGIENGATVIVDGNSGKVILNPNPETLETYRQLQQEHVAIGLQLQELRDQPAETLDGYQVALSANIELPEELDVLAHFGAKGIGLFRTEFFFMNRKTAPTEQEQYEIYRRALEAAAPHSVVFRTLDVGGDKLMMGHDHHAEQNPFMGQRAIRLCLQNLELFDTQLRAMLRASVHGPTKILIPMISGVEEILQVKEHVLRNREVLLAEGHAVSPDIEIGAMIEVPSAALLADVLANECDFFSIGTNDLIQYSLAVDRGNDRVANLYEPFHPAIIRFLGSISKAGQNSGIQVTVCGEMAADPIMAILLVGMGIDSLSMSGVSIPYVKQAIRAISRAEAVDFANLMLRQTTIAGCRAVVSERVKNHEALAQFITIAP